MSFEWDVGKWRDESYDHIKSIRFRMERPICQLIMLHASLDVETLSLIFTFMTSVGVLAVLQLYDGRTKVDWTIQLEATLSHTEWQPWPRILTEDRNRIPWAKGRQAGLQADQLARARWTRMNNILVQLFEAHDHGNIPWLDLSSSSIERFVTFLTLVHLSTPKDFWRLIRGAKAHLSAGLCECQVGATWDQWHNHPCGKKVATWHQLKTVGYAFGTWQTSLKS